MGWTGIITIPLHILSCMLQACIGEVDTRQLATVRATQRTSTSMTVTTVTKLIFETSHQSHAINCWRSCPYQASQWKERKGSVFIAPFISERDTYVHVRYMLSAVRLSSVCCLSVVCRLSVTLVHPTQAVELFGNFFSPYDSPGTLLLWCQKSLVGDAPFPLKFAFKVTHFL